MSDIEVSLAECSTLAECEAVIERGQQTFYEVAMALLKIREEELYHPDHETFADYCRNRWGWQRRNASQRLKAAEVLRNLDGTTVPLPTNERQIRSLAQLVPEQQREAWNATVQAANGQPTGRQVAMVVHARYQRRTKEEIDALKRIATAKKIQADVADARLKQFMIFRTLIDAVKFLAEFSMDSAKAWDGIWQAGGDESLDHIARAQVCLARLEREHPNSRKHGPIVQLSK